MFMASFSFTSMSALVKVLGPDIPAVQIVFLRCLLALPLLFIVVRRNSGHLLVRDRGLIFLRTIFGLIAMVGFFYSIARMPLADAVFIGRSEPLFLTILAPLVVKERAPRSVWIALITGTVGLALIFKPALDWHFAALVASGAAFSSALAHLHVRKLNRSETPLVIVFNFTLFTALFTSLFTLPSFVKLTGREWLILGGIALLATIGQVLMTTAYQKDIAPVVASSSYISVLLSLLYGYLFWGEIPHPLTWVGGTTIVMGGLILLKDRFKAHEPPTPLAH